MTDSDDGNDVREYELRDCTACGLLPREDYRAGATLAVRSGVEECATDRLYRAIPVRVDDAETTLLAGAWCEFEAGTAYRIASAGAGRRRRSRFVTVELAER